MMNEVGLKASWTVMQAEEKFFEVSKRLHNALHGAPLPLTSNMKDLFLAGAGQNRGTVREDADFVVLHDPQPLSLIPARSSHNGIWIWRCHIDLTEAKREVWRFLRPLVEMADDEIQEQLTSLGITELKPIILQVSRFDRLKDPIGVIRAYEIVKRSFDCQLILVGGSASDDPEGERCYQEVCQRAEGMPDLHVLRLPADSDAEINAL
jgi:trehalose synthase